MKRFQRRRGTIHTQLSAYEVELLASLVGQLVELVSDGVAGVAEDDAPPSDPFEEIVRDLDVDESEPPATDDPVLRRLFPDAYPGDPGAAAEFRRYTERGLRSGKVVDAKVVLQALAETEQGAHELRIQRAEVESWLRTLTSVRLAVATRLGITDGESAEELLDLPDDDPRAFMSSVYDWLGFAQETLIASL